MLLSYSISCCKNTDNYTPDLYLLLQHYLEINCLSLKLLVWCLLPYLESVTWWGHLKPLYSTVGRNLRDEEEMQCPGAGGRHNPPVPKTSQPTFDEDIGFNTTMTTHAIVQFIFLQLHKRQFAAKGIEVPVIFPVLLTISYLQSSLKTEY